MASSDKGKYVVLFTPGNFTFFKHKNDKGMCCPKSTLNSSRQALKDDIYDLATESVTQQHRSQYPDMPEAAVLIATKAKMLTTPRIIHGVGTMKKISADGEYGFSEYQDGRSTITAFITRIIARPSIEKGGMLKKLMNSDSGDSLASFISPRKSKAVRTNGAATAATAARGRGGLGGRGRTHSLGFAAGSSGEKNAVIDESMHENRLARKLHRDDIESMPTIKSDSVANSIMGKKTETVRQQQERLKAGFKDKIAELKKERSSKEMDAKASIGSSTARPSSLEEDMILIEVDDDANDNNDDAVDDSDKGDTVDDNNDDDVGTSVGIELPATTPIECDIGMPEIFDTVVSDGSATEDSSTTTSILTQSVSSPLKGDSAMGPIADPIELNGEKNSLSTTMPSSVETSGIVEEAPTVAVVASPVQPPSPSKRIQYPKVVELSQGESDVPRTSVKAKRDEKQDIHDMGLQLSDSDSGSEEDKSDGQMESVIAPTKTSLALPSKSAKISPLANEILKPSLEKNTACLSTRSASNALPGLSTRISKALSVDKASVHSSSMPSTTRASAVDPTLSTSSGAA